MISFRAKIIIKSKADIIDEIRKYIDKKYKSEDITYSIEEELTQREKEVLGLICNSKNNVEIGEIMHISPYTVKAHVSKICEKLNVCDRIQAAIKAIKENII